MKSITADWMRYNANSKDKSLGDCSIRAIAFAYGRDYDQVRNQLRHLKQVTRASVYNEMGNLRKYLQNSKAKPLTNFTPYDMDTAEFADKFPQGTYIVFTGPPHKHQLDHAACIVDGDLYDSWDSSHYEVGEAWQVTDKTTGLEYGTYLDIADALESYIDAYLARESKKYQGWFVCERNSSEYIDGYTCKWTIYVTTDKNLDSGSHYLSDYTYGKQFIVKLNPRMSIDKNLESLKVKCKQQIYNWVYQFEKDVRDTQAMKNVEIHPQYIGYNSRKLLKLPEWCRKYVKEFYISSNSEDTYPYYLWMDPLPGDSDTRSVSMYAYTLKDLKQQLQQYRADFTREY